MYQRPQTADDTSRRLKRGGVGDGNVNDKGHSTTKGERPRTAGTTRRKKFQKTLDPPKEKKVHAYKLGKTMSVSLKDTIYSGKKRVAAKVPEPVSVMQNSWISSNASFKKFEEKSINQLVMINMDLEKELHKDHLGFLAGKNHKDLMSRFNTQQEFANVPEIVDSMKEKERNEKLTRIQASQKRRASAMLSSGASPTRGRTNSAIAKSFDPLQMSSKAAQPVRQQSLHFERRGSEKDETPDLTGLLKKGQQKAKDDSKR